MVLLVTIGLHALVIAVLMTMKMGVPDVLQSIVTHAEFLPLDKPVQPPPPPLPLPEVVRHERLPVPEVPLPEYVPVVDDPAPGILQMPPADTGPVAADGPPSGSVPQVPSTALQYRVVRPTDDYYPSQSLSLQEQGTAIVRVCVTPAGRLDGKPVIDTSSGSARLDAAALTWAREALRFTPATRDGVAIAACKGFRVNFTLH
jgi:protein TonB